MLNLKVHESHLESSLSRITGRIGDHTSQTLSSWLQVSSPKNANCVVNEFLQSPMIIAGPFLVRWHVTMTHGWPNITPEGFQVGSNIQVFGVVPWAQDNSVSGLR